MEADPENYPVHQRTFENMMPVSIAVAQPPNHAARWNRNEYVSKKVTPWPPLLPVPHLGTSGDYHAQRSPCDPTRRPRSGP